MPAAEGIYFSCFGKTLPRTGKIDSNQAADDDAPGLHGAERFDALAQDFGNRLPGQGRGSGELLAAQHGRIGHEDPEAEDGHDRPRKNPGELGQELLAGFAPRR